MGDCSGGPKESRGVTDAVTDAVTPVGSGKGSASGFSIWRNMLRSSVSLSRKIAFFGGSTRYRALPPPSPPTPSCGVRVACVSGVSGFVVRGTCDRFNMARF